MRPVHFLISQTADLRNGDPLFGAKGPGILLAAAIGALATLLAAWEPVHQWGLSALTLAIALGVVFGNTLFPAVTARATPGVDYARTILLRAGIVLYGFRISMADLTSVGWHGFVIAAAMVALVYGSAIWMGTRWLGLDRRTSMLIGAGSAICGAAAVMATQPVARGEEHQVSIAVATVVVFGTLSMVLYPLLYPWLGMSEYAFGLYAGSTVHEVAQVVAIGDSIGHAATQAAVVEKMLRVMLLAPFLLLLSVQSAAMEPSAERGKSHWQRAVACGRAVRIPWFAVAFIGVTCLHSWVPLPEKLVGAIIQLDTFLLATAMVAMGMCTRVSSLKRAGVKPLQLAGMLFLVLTAGGYAVNSWVLQYL